MVKRVVGDLGSLLADAQERGEVAQNVVRSLSKRRKRREAERRQKGKLKVGVDIPTPAEIKAIVSHLQGRWRLLLLTAIFAGLRASEIRGLRWQDVDLKRGELHVRQRADKFKTIGKPKSVAGERSVPMPPILVNALREWKLVNYETNPPPRSARDLADLQSGLGHARRFARERREFAAGLRSDRTGPRPSCLSRCSSCGAPPLRVTTGGTGGLYHLRATIGAPSVTRHARPSTAR
jgi:integrase